MEQVMFKEEEKVDAQVPGDVFARYFKDVRASPHIFSWLELRWQLRASDQRGRAESSPWR